MTAFSCYHDDDKVCHHANRCGTRVSAVWITKKRLFGFFYIVSWRALEKVSSTFIFNSQQGFYFYKKNVTLSSFVKKVSPDAGFDDDIFDDIF